MLRQLFLSASIIYYIELHINETFFKNWMDFRIYLCTFLFKNFYVCFYKKKSALSNLPNHCYKYSVQWRKWLLYKTDANFFSAKLTGHTYAVQQFDKFWGEEFCCNLAKRHPYLRWCYKNQIGIKKSRTIDPVCLLSCF